MSADAGEEGPLLEFGRKAATLMEHLVFIDLVAHRQIEGLCGAEFPSTDLLEGIPAHFFEIVEEKTFNPQPLADENGAEFELFGNRPGSASRRVDEGGHVNVIAGKLLYLVPLLGTGPLCGRGTPPVAVVRFCTSPRSLAYHLDQNNDDDESDAAEEQGGQVESLFSGRAAAKQVRALSLCQHCKHG